MWQLNIMNLGKILWVPSRKVIPDISNISAKTESRCEISTEILRWQTEANSRTTEGQMMGSRTTHQEEHYTCNADTSDVADVYGVPGNYSVSQTTTMDARAYAED